ncbi:hypothetical protein BX666DRAFT_2024607 [Dichotomocladium elegans]|nr:hypothetical protein BX666DRAFT_2024607 [Dichotomocladium elegans]
MSVAVVTQMVHHTTSPTINKAYIGGAISITAGLVLGTARFYGLDHARTFTKHMTDSVADWVSAISCHHVQFPRALVDTAASHSNTPLEHLKLLNNAPISVMSAITVTYKKRSPSMFVFSSI